MEEEEVEEESAAGVTSPCLHQKEGFVWGGGDGEGGGGGGGGRGFGGG